MKNDFRVLSEKMLDRLLQVDSKKERRKAVSSPNAQIITQCPAGTLNQADNWISDTMLQKIKTEQPQLY